MRAERSKSEQAAALPVHITLTMLNTARTLGQGGRTRSVSTRLPSDTRCWGISPTVRHNAL